MEGVLIHLPLGTSYFNANSVPFAKVVAFILVSLRAENVVTPPDPDSSLPGNQAPDPLLAVASHFNTSPVLGAVVAVSTSSRSLIPTGILGLFDKSS